MPSNEHILVVEDEAHLATGIKYNLVAEGYRVTTVGDGPSALRILQGEPGSVDLVILDLMLPGMSGYAVCEALRAFDMDTPVLILTARTLTEDRTRGFEVGANQYLTKPFDLDEFLSRVKNLLTFHSRRDHGQWKQAGQIANFEFGDAKINFETFEVVVHDEQVRLTQLEMTLLRYFVENEGRVIPRRELLEKVWDVPGTLNTRAPDQFIRRLRKTFEPDPAQPKHFLTIRDAGYRFVAKPDGTTENQESVDDEDVDIDDTHEA
jgi:two-component system, OmpR family, alkaline phosphatase synthesis response regulator PhoP